VLCRTVLEGAAFTEPASIREIAETLVVSEAAVKQHLAHLYDKFGIQGGGERRRVRLANEALRRGAVTIAVLCEADARDGKRLR
jgi:DNA-binding CsgD family transcriptional regulator